MIMEKNRNEVDKIAASTSRYTDRTVFKVLGRDQFFTFSKRHDTIVDPCDLSAAQGQVPSQFRTDRADYTELPADCFSAPAHGRSLHRPPPEAILIGLRNGMHTGRPSGTWNRTELLARFSLPLLLSAQGRRSFTRSPRVWLAWHRVDGTDWHSRSSRSAAIWVHPWVP